jgi:hypothetical protein
MSERISRLCDELRIKLHGMDRRLEVLKSNGMATFDQSQGLCRRQFVSEFRLSWPRSQGWRTRCSKAGILTDQ